MRTTSSADLRDKLREVAATMTMREVAAGIGVTHFTVWKFLRGGNVWPSTLAKIQAWVDDPGEAHAAGNLKRALQRAVGMVRYEEKLRLEKDVGDLIRATYKRADIRLPSWVRAFGKRQRNTTEVLSLEDLRRVESALS